jgi:uncharacterized membrane protein YfcA
MHYLIAGIIGLVSGIASGLFGVGGGIVMVPAMIFLLSPPIRDIKQAVGTSLVVIIPTALMGSYKHFAQGNIEWRTALSLAPLAIAGSYFGAWLTTYIVADYLKRAFGGFIIFAGVKLLFFKRKQRCERGNVPTLYDCLTKTVCVGNANSIFSASKRCLMVRFNSCSAAKCSFASVPFQT